MELWHHSIHLNFGVESTKAKMSIKYNENNVFNVFFFPVSEKGTYSCMVVFLGENENKIFVLGKTFFTHK